MGAGVCAEGAVGMRWLAGWLAAHRRAAEEGSLAAPEISLCVCMCACVYAAP